jgi:putative ABC transport system permease protein
VNFLESVRVALEAIWNNKLRSLLTMLGIIIGIAAVIAVVAIGQGGQAVLMGEMEKIGANLFVVYVPWDTEEVPSEDDITLKDVKVIDELADKVKYITPSSFTMGKIRGPKEEKQVQVQGTTGEHALVRNVEIERGRFFSKEDVEASRRVAVLDGKLAKELFGQEDPLGQRVQMMGSAAVVIGISKVNDSFLTGGERFVAYVPITFMQQAAGNRWVNQLEGQATNKDTVDQAIDQTIKILERRHQKKDYYRAESLDQQMDIANNITGVMTLIISAIAGISLLVGGIGVMNIMLVSVTERTREIGIRKALGAKHRDILVQFLIEAITICLVGGILGTIFGAGLAWLIAKLAKWPPLISWATIAIAFLFSSAVGVFFGIYPANKAAKLDPIEALRYE